MREQRLLWGSVVLGGRDTFGLPRPHGRQGVTPRPRGGRGRHGPDAVAEMRRLRGAGWTLARVGQRFGITRERVRQLLAKAWAGGD